MIDDLLKNTEWPVSSFARYSFEAIFQSKGQLGRTHIIQFVRDRFVAVEGTERYARTAENRLHYINEGLRLLVDNGLVKEDKERYSIIQNPKV